MASTIYVRENLAVRVQPHVVRMPRGSEALIAVTLYLGVLFYPCFFFFLFSASLKSDF